MNRKGNAVLFLIIVVVIALAMFFFLQGRKSSTEPTANEQVEAGQESAEEKSALPISPNASEGTAPPTSPNASASSSPTAANAQAGAQGAKKAGDTEESEEEEVGASPTPVAQSDFDPKKQAERAFRLPKKIQLTEEQKQKMQAIQDKYMAKMTDLYNKQENILSDDQKQSRLQTALQNAFEGMPPEYRRQAIVESMKLSSEQQSQFRESFREIRKTTREIRQEISQNLTPDQVQNLPRNWNRPGRGPRN